jgi:O-antigen/teichoic acid export membrane protein
VDSTISQAIAKNTFWLFSGQIIGRLLRAAIVIYAARVLGAVSWGAFSYALSLAALLTIFSDFGINALLTREGVRSPELRRKYLATALALKIIMLSLLSGAALLLTQKVAQLEEAVELMPVMILVFVFDSLRDLGAAMARALEKMHLEAGANILTNLAIALLGLIFLTYSKTALSLTWGYALGTGFGLLAIVYLLREYFEGLAGNFDQVLAKKIIATAWPFGFLGLMGVVMVNTDVLMLGWLTSAQQTGLYSAAQKPIQLLYLVPTLIAAAFFPTFTKLAKQASGLKPVLETGLATVYLIALPLAAGGVILSAPIIRLLYGDAYLEAAPAFTILAATLAIVFPATMLANALFAQERQKNLISYASLGILGNVFFNTLLIPLWGVAGAALATLINQILINIYLWRQFKKINPFSILPRLKKIALATVLMSVIIILLKYYSINIIITIMVGMVAYLTTLILLKEPSLRLFRELIISRSDNNSA